MAIAQDYRSKFSRDANRPIFWVALLFILGVLFICYSIWNLTRAKTVIAINNAAAPVAVEENIKKHLESRLSIENQRLMSLESSYNSATIDDENPKVEQQVSTLSSRLDDLKGGLNEINQNVASAQQDMTTFEREQRIDVNTEQIQLQNQLTVIQNAQTQMAYQQNSNNPEVRDQVIQLQQQKIATEGALNNRPRQAEVAKLQAVRDLSELQQQSVSEKQDLQRQIADVSTELDYWKRRQSETQNNSGTFRQQHLQFLQQQIEQQRTQVDTLKNRLAVLKEN